jgi:hypothetical protein
VLDYEDMRDLQYGEENPGYQREVAYIPDTSDPDYDPEIAVLTAEKYAHDNRRRREGNDRTEINRLRALLEEHGIDPDDRD